MAANLKFTLKRNNGTDYDELYPKTNTAQVVGLSTALDLKLNTSARGAANGVASLDANSKIPVAQLPDSVFDSLYFYSTLFPYQGTYQHQLSDLAFEALRNVNNLAAGSKRSALGYYWVVSRPISLATTNTSGETYASVQFNTFPTVNSATSFQSSGYFGEQAPWFSTTTPTSTQPLNTVIAVDSGISLTFYRQTGSPTGNTWQNIGNDAPSISFVNGTSYYDARTSKLYTWNAASGLNGQLTAVAPTGVYIQAKFAGHEYTNADTAFNEFGGIGYGAGQVASLETGDWVVISKIEGLGTSADPYIVSFATVNNTYELATSSVDGIVRLSDGNAGVITDLTGNTVITEGNLIGMVYTAGTDLNGLTGANLDKLAKTDHTHSNYQPLDADLTKIAGLSSADNNFIVGSSTGWVAESGATARASLGVTIGTHVQAYDAGLNSIAGLTTVADRMLYTTASDQYAVTTLTAAGRALLDDANASAQRTTLGLAIGTDVQAYSARLGTIAGLAITDGNIIVGNGTTWVAESGATARTSLGVYSTSEVDAFFTNRPTILYNTTTGAVSGSLILADVVTA
jgi:hypothetical protein